MLQSLTTDIIPGDQTALGFNPGVSSCQLCVPGQRPSPVSLTHHLQNDGYSLGRGVV